ncbi:UNVERIFIED_CONTAM: hypothetical protein NCL1_56814 [Trichonephila clavipes]
MGDLELVTPISSPSSIVTESLKSENIPCVVKWGEIRKEFPGMFKTHTISCTFDSFAPVMSNNGQLSFPSKFATHKRKLS